MSMTDIKTAWDAYMHARNVVGGRWPEGEAAVAQEPHAAYRYARNVVRGPWPEGEAAIARDSLAAYCYARNVVRGPWPEGEAAIATDPYMARLYAEEVIGGPWPHGEAAVAQEPHESAGSDGICDAEPDNDIDDTDYAILCELMPLTDDESRETLKGVSLRAHRPDEGWNDYPSKETVDAWREDTLTRLQRLRDLGLVTMVTAWYISSQGETTTNSRERLYEATDGGDY